MPNYDLFSPLLLITTFEEMTIKHLMYTQKVPFPYTERACVSKFALEDFSCRTKCSHYFGPEGVYSFIQQISLPLPSSLRLAVKSENSFYLRLGTT